MSRIRQVLSFQSRQDDQDSEDKWLTDRIKVLPNVKLPDHEAEKKFAVEGVWDEKPMGIHIPSSSDVLLRDVWDDPGRRKQILEYCPEIKMIVAMKLERERCQDEKVDEQAEAAKQAEIAKQAEALKLKEAEQRVEEEKEKNIEEEKQEKESEDSKQSE